MGRSVLGSPGVGCGVECIRGLGEGFGGGMRRILLIIIEVGWLVFYNHYTLFFKKLFSHALYRRELLPGGFYFHLLYLDSDIRKNPKTRVRISKAIVNGFIKMLYEDSPLL